MPYQSRLEPTIVPPAPLQTTASVAPDWRTTLPCLRGHRRVLGDGDVCRWDQDFTFEEIGVHPLEARSAVKNGRSNGALRKLDAVQEGVLRRSFERHGEYLDQALRTILPEERLRAKTVWGSHAIH